MYSLVHLDMRGFIKVDPAPFNVPGSREIRIVGVGAAPAAVVAPVADVVVPAAAVVVPAAVVEAAALVAAEVVAAAAADVVETGATVEVAVLSPQAANTRANTSVNIPRLVALALLGKGLLLLLLNT